MDLLFIWCVLTLILFVALHVIMYWEGEDDQEECIAIALASVVVPLGVIVVVVYLVAKLLMVVIKAMTKHED